MTTLTPFQLTPLGLFHTLVSLLAVVTAFVALFRDREITPRTSIGRVYLLSLLVTTLTGFPIFRHGTAGPPHVLGVITMVVLAVAFAAEKSWFGRASAYVRTTSYSATVLLLMIPTFTETLTRVPPGAPLVASPEAPIFPPLYLGLLVIFVVGLTLQLRKLRAAQRAAGGVIALLLASSPLLAAPAGFSERFADVNGVKLHYLVGGKGSPVVLLHGYAQTSHMWTPIMPLLAEHHTVIVPDLRGAGGSARPESGYDKRNMAVDIHGLTSSLGFDRVSIVGHDIGLMVAYAYAAQFPNATERVVLMDAFLPGIGNWKDVWLMRDLWHFHFYGEVPLALVKGRERTYFEHFWNDFAADPKHSVKEADRQLYARAYAQPGGMRAGFEYFRNFERDVQDFARLSATPLPMPVLVLTGEKASGEFLIDQARLVATNVKGVVIAGSGHWLIDEAPDKVIPQLLAFIDESR